MNPQKAATFPLNESACKTIVAICFEVNELSRQFKKNEVEGLKDLFQSDREIKEKVNGLLASDYPKEFKTKLMDIKARLNEILELYKTVNINFSNKPQIEKTLAELQFHLSTLQEETGRFPE
ncbi:hypothetical protein [Sinomicrobium sp. M5D2P17]